MATLSRTPSRTPSPAVGSGSDSDSVVATPMTPRTKLRELFATIDDGDGDSSGSEQQRGGDEENQTPSRKAKKASGSALSAGAPPKVAGTSAFPRVSAAVSPLRTTSASRSHTSSPREEALRMTSDDESDVEVRPRGRFAARMQAAVPSLSTGELPAKEPRADNARERVKQMLQQKNAQGEKQQQSGERATSSLENSEDTSNEAEHEGDDEDEDSAPIAAAPRPRKRLTAIRTSRRSASVSPHPAPTPSRTSVREDSPAMFMTPTKRAEREDSPDMFMTPTKGGDDHGIENDDAGTENPGRHARLEALVARKRKEARAREEAEEKKRAARQAALAEDDTDEASSNLDEDDELLMRDADDINGNVSDITDDEGGRRLTQEVGGARPARMASKKALEEMHRETQRMTRNLQLAHEAKTRKKITKASLFERFNFRPAAAAAAPGPVANEPASSSRPTSPTSPQNHSDTEMRGVSDTPPSSPPVPVDSDAPSSASKLAAAAAAAAAMVPAAKVDNGKGKAVEILDEPSLPQPQPKRQVRVRMPLPVQANLVLLDSDEDGELEIVQTTKNKLDILFDNVPLKRNQEPRSLLTLRRLAQVGSPGKKTRSLRVAKDGSSKADLTLGELQQNLQERARRQAKLEREEHLEKLRAKGIRIQTEEEREREMEEVDNIVARARQEAEELMKREREEAKKDRARSGDADGADSAVDPLDWDDSEDEEGGGDYEPEKEESEREIELSGSEDEASEVEGGEEEGEETVEGALIDDAADSAEESEHDLATDGAHAEAGVADGLPTPTRARPAKRRAALVISDDEDEDDEAAAAATPLPPKIEVKTPGPKFVSANTPSGLGSNSNDSPQVPTSVLRSATKPFIPGMPVAVGGPAGLSLTQIFAGTLNDDSQFDGTAASGGFGSPSQLMPTIGNFADAGLSQTAVGSTAPAAAILDSQPTQEWIKRMQGGGSNAESNEGVAGTGPSQLVQLNFSQTQAHGLDSLLREPDVSQMSELLGPSQDVGPQEYTPLKVRFIEHQPLTLDTVILDGNSQAANQATQLLPSQSQSQMASPSPAAAPTRPRGRLLRKTEVARIVEEEEDQEEAEEDVEQIEEHAVEQTSAFAKLQRAAAAQTKAYDRKKSKAKEMVEELAEESDDEYAGLGGGDGEDSDDESLASVKDIIDDDQKVSSADNAKLAAFYADRERASDEKQVEKLFRDVTTGMLRRKRGAGGGGGDYDLSDSDDGGEARRRMKRRQFARMQKALFADERVSKVAENPRNQAFLRTIEDRGSDDEMDFIFDGPGSADAHVAAAPEAQASASASTGAPPQAVAIPDSQPPAAAAAAAAPAQPQHSHPRRRRLSATTSGKKPANLGEIRETLSTLLEDYHHDGTNLSVVADSEFGSDNEEGVNKENDPLGAASSSSSSAALRRGSRHSHNVQVVDRISLKRNNSSASSASSSSSSGAAAAAAPGSVGAGAAVGFSSMGPTGFRVPALLRRATTNSLVSNGSSSSSSGGSGSGRGGSGLGTMRGADKNSAGGVGNSSKGPDDGKIKKNASKMSGIHYFARETERRAAIAESEKRRQAKKVRGAEGRSRAVGGLFGAGKFE